LLQRALDYLDHHDPVVKEETALAKQRARNLVSHL
jgi:hypothetical protein